VSSAVLDSNSPETASPANSAAEMMMRKLPKPRMLDMKPSAVLAKLTFATLGMM